MAEAPTGVAGCSQTDIELVVSQVWVVSQSLPQLPLQIEDASRPENEVSFNLRKLYIKKMQKNNYILILLWCTLSFLLAYRMKRDLIFVSTKIRDLIIEYLI